MDLSPGARLLGRYDVIRPLGAGAMGTAWLVTDRLWRTELALKTMRSALHAESLRREFAVLASLAHPSLLRVHDLGCPSALVPGGARLWFYTADFIDGRPLLEAARGQRWGRVRRFLLPCLEAIRVLHRAGIRHGDIKPSHVLVRPDGHAVLLDFGCAGPLIQPAQTQVSGTKGYLAPELLAGEVSDQRADLYALGVMLARTVDVLASSPPGSVLSLISRLTAGRPEDRPADVDEVLASLGVEPARLPPAMDRMGRLAGREAELGAARAWILQVAGLTAGPRFLHLRGARGVGRSRFLREVKWEAQQHLTVVEAHPRAPGSLARALRLALHDDELPVGLSPVLDAVDRLGATPSAPVLLVVDDLEGFPSRDREVIGALARSLDATSTLAVAASECTTTPMAGEGALSLALSPLTPAQLSSWLTPRLDDEALAELHAATGGYPSRIAAALGARSDSAVGRGPRRRLPLLPAAATGALVVLVAMEGVLTDADADGLGIGRDALWALHTRGLVARDGFLWKLGSVEEGGWLAGAVKRGAVRAGRERVAAYLMQQALGAGEDDPTRASRLAALAVRQQALAGEVDAAGERAMVHRPWHALAPAEWAKTLALTAAGGDPRIAMQAARCEADAGQVGAALRRLEEVARIAGGDARLEALLEAGQIFARISEHAAAMDRFGQVLAAEPDARIEARACDAMARSCIRLARYREATQWAERGLGLSPMASLEAALRCSAGMAHSHLGEWEEADDQLGRALARLDDASTASERVRVLDSMGVHATRTGRLPDAARRHGEALALARDHGLHASMATAALHLGAVLHQQGDLAGAREAYGRGLRVAVALGQHGTEAWLLCDLAKLQADLGQFERALRTAERCAAVAERIGDKVTGAAAAAVSGEVAVLSGAADRGAKQLTAAREVFASQASPQEQVELELRLAESRLLAGDPPGAGERIAAARALMGEGESAARDLRIRYAIVEARWALQSGRLDAAAAGLDAALDRAREAGLRDAAAEVHALLAATWQSRGAPAVAQGFRLRAREEWERMAASLAPSEREAFWRHPRRATLALSSDPQPVRGASTTESRLRLLLEVHKHITSSLAAEEVLRRGMDGAVALTGAERGFLLLRRESGELEVRAADDANREPIATPHLAFVRSLAERVMETREPVVTADAQADGRLRAEESVRAMGLRWVACVPVQSPSGVLGALYLDDRSSRGQVLGEDTGLLRALADQLGIAVTNARLHGELQRRNRELEEERKRVEDLATGQSARLQRLEEEARRARPGVVGDGARLGRVGFEQEQVQRIVEVLRAHRWNVTRALPELGIPRATLYRLLKRHGILER